MSKKENPKIREVYEAPHSMEPLFPESSRHLEVKAFQLAQRSAALGSMVHPITCAAVVEVVRSMNSYYSNLIEGHNTHPLDIERALAQHYSSDPSKRALQLESKAHVDVQRLIEVRLRDTPETEICTSEFIQWIHREFYERLPDEFRNIETEGGGRDVVIPGEIRKGEIIVHRHIGPRATSLPAFLARFHAGYEPAKLTPMRQIVAAAASHHRLAWIHPFLDGNGRVTRLYTHAYLIKTGLSGHGLWMVSRGFARSRDLYMQRLALADGQRRGDLDGRGNLSEKALIDFCDFFLDVCLDQVEFMTRLLELDSMQPRLVGFAEEWCRQTASDSLRRLSNRVGHLLGDLFLRGELTRGEATSILRIPERTAREVFRRMGAEKVLVSGGPGKPLRLGFPASVTGYYFPKLYPDSVALDLQRLSSAQLGLD